MAVQAVRISLVITTYNRAALLAKALASVAESNVDDRSQIEIIVVDNNSTDATRKTVDDVRACGFPFTLRYVFEQHQGLSYARNRGADEAKGTYLVYMDDDQLIEKHYLSRIDPAFQSTQAACIGGPLFYHNKEIIPAWLSPLIVPSVEGRNYGDKRRIMASAREKLPGGNMVFDRQALINVGKFDVRLGRCGDALLDGEDDELQERLHAAGEKVAYDPGLVQYHHLDPARLTKRFWRRHFFDHGRSVYRMKQSKPTAHQEPSFLGAPRWLWRYLLTREIPRAMRPLLHLDMTQGFYNQLDVWTCLGQIHEARQANSAHAKT